MFPRIGVCFAILGAALQLSAQVEQATLLGTITDSTAKVIPGASVTVLNLGTGERRATLSDDRGNYQATALNIGAYEVTVEQPGFRKQTVSGITLVVNQVARIDVKLEVGQVSEELTVRAEAQMIQTDDATVSQLINSNQILELPIPANRNMFRLALMGGGMSRGPAGGYTTSGFGPGFGISAYGQKIHNNWFILDGAPLKTAMHGQVRMRPSVEALEEFRVEGGFYNAELGTQSGAQIISAIRPGGNAFHGTIFEFLRNDVLDARTFFESPTTPKQPLRRNNFGAVVSGRIIRDKLFFTTNYEGYIERTSSQAFGVYPTDAMKQGDLSAPYFQNTVIRDAVNGGTPFPNNQIPANRISIQSQKLLQYFLEPNLPGAFTGVNNYTGHTVANTNDHQGFVRMDYNMNANNRFFVRYGIERVDNFAQPVSTNPIFGQAQPRHQQNVVATYTRTFSPTKLNELSISYNRDIFGTVDNISGSNFNIARDLLIPGLTNDPYATGIPSISVTGLTGFGTTAPNTIWEENRRVADTFSLSHGSHLLKLGVDYQRVLTRRQTFQYVDGIFGFTGSQSGSAFADFLLDWPNLVEEGFAGDPRIRAGEQFCRLFGWRLPSFVTDDWKVTPKLTISMGLRWELNSPIRDTRGLVPNFDFTTQQLYPALFHSQYLYNWNRHDFAPRFGLAFRPFGGDKTVVRASYGVFYNVIFWNNIQAMDVNPPFLYSINQTNPPGNPLLTMANAYSNATVSGTTKPEVLGVPPDYGLANTQQWTLTMQRALPSSTLLELDYVGSKSTHYDIGEELNLINVLAGQTARPLPQWGDIEFIAPAASGTYEAVILKVEKHTARGLTFLSTYTFSKTLFDAFAGEGSTRPSDPFDARAEKGLAETDQRHRVTASALYELPFFRGQRGLAGHLLGGWQTNGVFNFETGLPMFPVQPTEAVADGCPRCGPRPDRLANGNLPSDQRSLQRWFNTSAFKIASGHYGTSGRNILTAPGLTNLDFSLFKNVRVAEDKRIQIRWEMYNATNTPPFNVPGLTIGTGTFGQVTSSGVGRVMQFGLRYEF